MAKKIEFEMETVIMQNSELPTAPGDDWSWVIGERSCNAFQNATLTLTHGFCRFLEQGFEQWWSLRMFEAHEMLIQCMMNPSALPSRASSLYTFKSLQLDRLSRRVLQHYARVYIRCWNLPWQLPLVISWKSWLERERVSRQQKVKART